MVGDENRFDGRSLDSDIRVMQTVYGIFLVVGFRELAVSFCKFTLDSHRAWANCAHLLLPLSLAGLALFFLGIRFFWATGNIQRFVLRRPVDPKKRVNRFAVTIHFPILICHAFAYYVLCNMHAAMQTEAELVRLGPLFVYSYAGFLMFNVVWLSVLVIRQAERQPEATWIINNLTFAIVAVALFCVLERRGVSLPTTISTLCCVFLANSFVDLWLKAGTYIWHPSERINTG